MVPPIDQAKEAWNQFASAPFYQRLHSSLRMSQRGGFALIGGVCGRVQDTHSC
jgi:hypothetical protein